MIYASMKQSLPNTMNNLSRGLKGVKTLVREMEKKQDLKDLRKCMNRIAKEL